MRNSKDLPSNQPLWSDRFIIVPNITRVRATNPRLRAKQHRLLQLSVVQLVEIVPLWPTPGIIFFNSDFYTFSVLSIFSLFSLRHPDTYLPRGAYIGRGKRKTSKIRPFVRYYVFHTYLLSISILPFVSLPQFAFDLLSSRGSLAHLVETHVMQMSRGAVAPDVRSLPGLCFPFVPCHASRLNTTETGIQGKTWRRKKEENIAIECWKDAAGENNDR